MDIFEKVSLAPGLREGKRRTEETEGGGFRATASGFISEAAISRSHWNGMHTRSLSAKRIIFSAIPAKVFFSVATERCYCGVGKTLAEFVANQCSPMRVRSFRIAHFTPYMPHYL